MALLILQVCSRSHDREGKVQEENYSLNEDLLVITKNRNKHEQNVNTNMNVYLKPFIYLFCYVSVNC